MELEENDITKLLFFVNVNVFVELQVKTLITNYGIDKSISSEQKIVMIVFPSRTKKLS